MIPFLTLAFVGLLIAGLWLLRRAVRQRDLAGMPRGRVIYADTGAWQRVEQPLFSRRYRLTGKPDYLVEDQGQIVPVEVKSGNAPPEPYPSHVLQLAAYCLLVKESHGVPPAYGVIRYRDGTFAVDYIPALEDWLLDTLDDMGDDAEAGDVPRSHDNPAQCAACGYRPHCDQSLV
jgi:CRISPR-associated exonuclease Cas4